MKTVRSISGWIPDESNIRFNSLYSVGMFDNDDQINDFDASINFHYENRLFCIVRRLQKMNVK
jgi:hypothetical protein